MAVRPRDPLSSLRASAPREAASSFLPLPTGRHLRRTYLRAAIAPHPQGPWRFSHAAHLLCLTALASSACFDFRRPEEATPPGEDGSKPGQVPASRACGQAQEGGTFQLSCPAGTIVQSIAFASYGTPTGACGSFAAGACKQAVVDRVEKACLGRSSCTISPVGDFGPDPCYGTKKTLAVEAVCGPGNPSCAGGLKCNGTDCCARASIPAGTFPRGRSASGSDSFAAGGTDELPEHQAKIEAFEIDLFEVTVGRFRRFVDAYEGPPSPGSGAHPSLPDSGWMAAWDALVPANREKLLASLQCSPKVQTWTPTPDANESKPMGCLDWYTAFAFCTWDGGRLLSEAEWEYVAAGGDENRLFPWGKDAPSSALLYRGTWPIPDVGAYTKGSSRWGTFDQAGSVWEWVLDSNHTYPMGECEVCGSAQPDSATNKRGARGGHFGDVDDMFRSASRHHVLTDYRASQVGARCGFSRTTP